VIDEEDGGGELAADQLPTVGTAEGLGLLVVVDTGTVLHPEYKYL